MNDTVKTYWKFRTNWRGKLILQRLSVWEDDGHEYSEWRDADAGDLKDYYKEVKDELQRFAELVRAEALENAASVLEGLPMTINNVQHRETQHAGSWQVESTVGRFVFTNAAKIRSLK